MTMREFVIPKGQTIEKGHQVFGLVYCSLCTEMVTTQPVVLKDKGLVKHDGTRREHVLGMLERLYGKWWVREMPTKRRRKSKSPYPYVYMPVVTNAVGRGKRQ